MLYLVTFLLHTFIENIEGKIKRKALHQICHTMTLEAGAAVSKHEA